MVVVQEVERQRLSVGRNGVYEKEERRHHQAGAAEVDLARPVDPQRARLPSRRRHVGDVEGGVAQLNERARAGGERLHARAADQHRRARERRQRALLAVDGDVAGHGVGDVELEAAGVVDAHQRKARQRHRARRHREVDARVAADGVVARHALGAAVEPAQQRPGAAAKRRQHQRVDSAAQARAGVGAHERDRRHAEQRHAATDEDADAAHVDRLRRHVRDAGDRAVERGHYFDRLRAFELNRVHAQTDTERNRKVPRRDRATKGSTC